MKSSTAPSGFKLDKWQLVVSVGFLALIAPALAIPLVLVAVVALPAIALAFPFFVASTLQLPTLRRAAPAPHRRRRPGIDTTNPVPSHP